MSKENAANSDNQNPLGDVTNVLGLLLAGFGAVLSFLGLRSAEVTTVLRNDPGQASFIVLFLLLGVLAAVLTVATKSASAKNAPLLLTVGVVVALFGMGALVIHFIPIGTRPGTAISLMLGIALISVGLIMFVTSIAFLKSAPLLLTVGAVVALFGMGALVIHFVPIGPTGKTISQWLGIALISVGLIMSVVIACRQREGDRSTGTAKSPQSSGKMRVDETTVLIEKTVQGQSGEETGETKVLVALQSSSTEGMDKPTVAGDNHRYASESLWYWLLGPLVPITVIFILSSVIFIAISAYGGMRLETKSQLSFSSQVGASFSVDGPLTTVSVDITATKLQQNDWIFVDIYAVRADTNLMTYCETDGVPQFIPDYTSPKADPVVAAFVAHCTTDPCQYFAGQIDWWPNACKVLLSGTIDPDAAGDVGKTLSVAFMTAKYEDIDVRAEVCQPNPNERCASSSSGQNSRLDWVISNSQITPAN